MDHHNQTILVTGATGRQGGAVARHLLADGWRVQALVREPGKPTAEALAEQGIELVHGDLDDAASLKRALAGVYGVYSVQNFWLPGVGVEGERRQGKTLADAAGDADVKHFVYSSVGGAERNTGIAHFESKWQIEHHIRALGLPATVLRPVYFMENLFWQRQSIVEQGILSQPALRPDVTLQMIAVDDIGAFAALAFAKPEQFVGKAMEIAGDEMTLPEAAEVLSRVSGRPVRYVPAETPPGGANADNLKMQEWFNESGYQAYIPALRRLYPGLTNLETWLQRTGWGKP
jgi:uncharacterized protein YbjT (DUF2867 family)